MTTGPVLSRQTTAQLRRGAELATAAVATAVQAEPAPGKTLADAQRAHITATLRETNWVIGGPRGAAAQLGLPRTTLISRMQRLGISSGPAGQRPEQPAVGFRSLAAAGSWAMS